MRSQCWVQSNQWKLLGAVMPLLLGALGCPHAFGRGGTIDRAAHKDVEEGASWFKCPPPEEVAEYCAKQPDPEDCYSACAGDE